MNDSSITLTGRNFLTIISHRQYLWENVMLGSYMMLKLDVAFCIHESLIVIAGTAAAFGLLVEGVGIILGVDRILDMARTSCNLIGNCVATVVVARWENEIPDDVLAYAQSYE